MASLCFAVLHKKQGDDSSLTRWADKKHIVAKECDERNLLHPSKLWQRFSFFYETRIRSSTARIKAKLFMKRHIILYRRRYCKNPSEHSTKLLGSKPSFMIMIMISPRCLYHWRERRIKLGNGFVYVWELHKISFLLWEFFPFIFHEVASNPTQAVSHQKRISPSRFLINFSISFTPLKCSTVQRVALSIVMKRS